MRHEPIFAIIGQICFTARPINHHQSRSLVTQWRRFTFDRLNECEAKQRMKCGKQRVSKRNYVCMTNFVLRIHGNWRNACSQSVYVSSTRKKYYFVNCMKSKLYEKIIRRIIYLSCRITHLIWAIKMKKKINTFLD